MNRVVSFLFALKIFLFGALLLGPSASAQTIHFGNAISQTLPKIVKIVGSGGSRGLEAYQSGVLVSADGHVLTCLLYTSPSPRD